ncbi:CLUMA_CG019200, isoform A [Clunio marinus]|uniref:CLUMA_CG019200, isoform A n=1 Tax=Clunio marinus TaxID=568069 RepID=A0A1J1J1N2_9DIPT|nr:CLUMA_CG019200, isoform A [Clunio marinus]
MKIENSTNRISEKFSLHKSFMFKITTVQMIISLCQLEAFEPLESLESCVRLFTALNITGQFPTHILFILLQPFSHFPDPTSRQFQLNNPTMLSAFRTHFKLMLKSIKHFMKKHFFSIKHFPTSQLRLS